MGLTFGLVYEEFVELLLEPPSAAGRGHRGNVAGWWCRGEAGDCVSYSCLCARRAASMGSNLFNFRLRSHALRSRAVVKHIFQVGRWECYFKYMEQNYAMVACSDCQKVMTARWPLLVFWVRRIFLKQFFPCIENSIQSLPFYPFSAYP